ncbi:hypothetical protein Lalb_Chr25g0282851 [Lupinus albus]|uniref:Uncharacterized protein n=1 Tax=Lupinus albus TaxID=3870 RepID=A0A6A4MYB9_LUPAL|nr:hypothetical protein Lalb_Chr25g0282851 [Lupinus albus]
MNISYWVWLVSSLLLFLDKISCTFGLFCVLFLCFKTCKYMTFFWRFGCSTHFEQ